MLIFLIKLVVMDFQRVAFKITFMEVQVIIHLFDHPNYPWVDDAIYHLQTLSNLPYSVGADDIALNPNYQSYSDPYKLQSQMIMDVNLSLKYF